MTFALSASAQRIARAAFWLVLIATIVQLAAGALLDLPQFHGKAFGARLIAYPVAMLALPAGWIIAARLRGVKSATPWAAAALIAWSFLADVSGNTLDLYDRIGWWDDLNHFANWFTLTLGVGLCLTRADVRPRWMLGLATVGAGAILAIGWELAEWYTFIRHGTELSTAYEDTLLDETLGTLGALGAALVIMRITAGRALVHSPNQRALQE